MTAPGQSEVLGRWRIVEITSWSADYVDMLGPGYIQLDPDGGQMSFGDVQIGLGCWYGKTSVHFTFRRSDEGTEVLIDGEANLERDGTLGGELNFHHGNDMPLIAKRWSISAAC